MALPLKLLIKYCLVLLLILHVVDLKRSDDKNRRGPRLSDRSPEKTLHADRGHLDSSYEFEKTSQSVTTENTSEERDGDTKTRRDPAVVNIDDLVYIGCYDVWQYKNGNFVTDEFPQYNGLLMCAKLCKSLNDKYAGPEYIVSVRGDSCFCPYMWAFSLVRVDDAYCPLPCPDETEIIETTLTCGGNFSVSAYCLKGTETCSEFIRPPTQNLYLYDEFVHKNSPPPVHRGFDVQSSRATLNGEGISPIACGNCSFCRGTLIPSFDYIPENSPVLCAQFCGRSISYYRNGILTTRDPMPFALTGWVNKSIAVPACGCGDTDLEDVIRVSDDYCDTPCVGGESCGSDYWQFMVSIYASKVPTAPEPSDPIGNHTEPSSPSTVAEAETEENDTSESGEKSTTTKMPHVASSSTKPPPMQCNGGKQCVALDPYGTIWTVCAGEIFFDLCPNGASGESFWKCLQNGEFEGTNPNYDDCSTVWIKEIEAELSGNQQSSASEILTKILQKCSKAMELGNADAQYFGHEIQGLLNIVDSVIKHENLTQEVELPEFEGWTQLVINIGSYILMNPVTWKQLSLLRRSEAATSFIWTLEESSFELTEKAEADGQFDYIKELRSEEISMAAGVSIAENATLIFKDDEGSFIALPREWVTVVPEAWKYHYSGMAIGGANHLGNVFPNNISDFGEHEKHLNGKIMSLSLMRPSNTATSDITFQDSGVSIGIIHEVHAWANGERRDLRRKLHFGEKRKAILGTAVCVYWDMTRGIWSRDGCKLVSSELTATHCECSHLTSFAVLMDKYNYVGKSVGLEVLTLILCPLSVISLFATIVIFSIVKTTLSSRTVITKNLAFCLLIGNSLVLVVVDRHYINMSEGVCTVAAIVTHYTFLSAFMWMAVEGYQLYKMMVQVFDSGISHTTIMRVLAYGLPLIVILMTGVIGVVRGERAYGGVEFCWLNGNYIFAFMVPIALVIFGNLIVLFITMRTACRVQFSPSHMQERRKSYTTWIRGCFSITILLGLTWIIGYLQLVNSVTSEIIAYFFTILNASQGIFLFVYHCLLNDKVRLAAERSNIPYLAWLSSVSATATKTTSGQSSGSNGNSRIRKQKMKASDSTLRVEKKFDLGGLFKDARELPRTNIRNNVNNIQHNRIGTVSSVDSVMSSGNETNGSQKQLYSERSERN